MNVCLCGTPPRQTAQRARRIEMRDQFRDRSWHPASVGRDNEEGHAPLSLSLLKVSQSKVENPSLEWTLFRGSTTRRPQAEPPAKSSKASSFGCVQYLALNEVSTGAEGTRRDGADRRRGGGATRTRDEEAASRPVYPRPPRTRPPWTRLTPTHPRRGPATTLLPTTPPFRSTHP